MKSSEAKPLTGEEVQTLKSLLQRWILVTYPFYGGGSEESDAFTTYDNIGSHGPQMSSEERFGGPEELQKRIEDYGESQL